MESFEQQIAFSHLLLEVSKELISGTPETINDIIIKSLYEIGELLMAKSIKIQLFNDQDDLSDDDMIAWSIFGEESSITPFSDDLIMFFMEHEPVIEAGETISCFKEEPFETPAIVYPMLVHGQPIGFVMFELMTYEESPSIKKMIKHVIDIFTKAFKRRQRDTMIFEHASISAATLEAIDQIIIAVNDTGHIELINGACQNAFGISSETTVGKSLLKVFSLVNKTYDMPIDEFLIEMIETQGFLPVEDPLDVTVGDTVLEATMAISPKYDSDHMYQGVVIILSIQ